MTTESLVEVVIKTEAANDAESVSMNRMARRILRKRGIITI